jgi:aspartyl-tRNA(Asn)/glutamyl-tRNA(Gln) amidotransferase subunit B
LPEYDADILTGDRSLSEYFEKAAKAYNGDPKRLSNWLINDVLRMINDLSISAGGLKLAPDYLVEIIKLVDAGTINNNVGKALLEKVQQTGISPLEIVRVQGLAQVSDQDTIRAMCTEVLDENPNEIASYKNGKVTLMGWFVGQVMKKSHGKADPQLARSILEDLLH